MASNYYFPNDIEMMELDNQRSSSDSLAALYQTNVDEQLRIMSQIQSSMRRQNQNQPETTTRTTTTMGKQLITDWDLAACFDTDIQEQQAIMLTIQTTMRIQNHHHHIIQPSRQQQQHQQPIQMGIGLDANEIEQLPVKTIDSPNVLGQMSEKSCSICLQDYSLNDQLKTMPCFHVMHKTCLDIWLTQNAKCPICNSRVK